MVDESSKRERDLHTKHHERPHVLEEFSMLWQMYKINWSYSSLFLHLGGKLLQRHCITTFCLNFFSVHYSTWPVLPSNLWSLYTFLSDLFHCIIASSNDLQWYIMKYFHLLYFLFYFIILLSVTPYLNNVLYLLVTCWNL